MGDGRRRIAIWAALGALAGAYAGYRAEGMGEAPLGAWLVLAGRFGPGDWEASSAPLWIAAGAAAGALLALARRRV